MSVWRDIGVTAKEGPPTVLAWKMGPTLTDSDGSETPFSRNGFRLLQSRSCHQTVGKNCMIHAHAHEYTPLGEGVYPVWDHPKGCMKGV